jgi:hypothetical protein
MVWLVVFGAVLFGLYLRARAIPNTRPVPGWVKVLFVVSAACTVLIWLVGGLLSRRS